MKGKVTTVFGDVDPSELGKTLPHEHVSLEIIKPFYKTASFRPHLQDCEFSMGNLGWIRQNPYSHILNMQLNGPEVTEEILREIKVFKEAGGGTIVENTSTGITLPRNTEVVKLLSKHANINFIIGTGYYVESSQEKETLSYSQEKMENVMSRDLTEGFPNDIFVKAGFIGEVGCSWPITDFEKRSIRASGSLESSLGCPVMFHPGRHEDSPEEIIRIYSEAGGNPKRAVMAHLDRTIQDLGGLLEFAELQTFLEFDLFGIETSEYQQQPDIFMPSDGQRIDRIKHLVENGFENRILISHDIHTRHRLENYGGHGFCHIFNTVVPMMTRRGIPSLVIDKILIANPAKWLTYAK